MDGGTSGQVCILSAAWDVVLVIWAFRLGVVACLLFLVWCWLFRREIDYSFGRKKMRRRKVQRRTLKEVES